MSSVIEVNNVFHKYQDGYCALNGISFHADKSEKIGIVGANGAGKSTMLKMIVGLLSISSGSILVNGKEVNDKNIKNIRNDIGFIFQESDNQLFMNTVYDDIAFGLRSRHYDEHDIKLRIDMIAEKMNLSSMLNKAIYKLSGGEKKLVSIAGILVMEPEIILMDEPTASLDPRARRNIINIINYLPQTIVVATHDLDMVLDCCERVILFNKGKIVCEGKTYDVMSNKELMEANGLELPLSMPDAKCQMKAETL